MMALAVAALVGTAVVPMAAPLASANHGDRCEGIFEEAKCKGQDVVYCVEPLVHRLIHDLKCKVGKQLNHKPRTPDDPSGPTGLEIGDTGRYCTGYEDPDGNNGYITFGWDDGSSTTHGPLESGDEACASQSWSRSASYCVTAYAEDKYGQPSDRSGCGWVHVDDNDAPTGDTPSGPDGGTEGETLQYCTTASDPEGHDIEVTFDWDDGSTATTGFRSSGSTFCADHAWSVSGDSDYPCIRARARDAHGAEGGWSAGHCVYIMRENSPPGRPSAPSGPLMADEGASSEFCTSADDPDGSEDSLQYTFHWDDGSSTTPSTRYSPGSTACASHSWDDGETGVSERWISATVEDEFYETATSDESRVVLQDDCANREDAPSTWDGAVPVNGGSCWHNYMWEDQGDGKDKFTISLSADESIDAHIQPAKALDGTCRNPDLEVWDPSGDFYARSDDPGCETDTIHIDAGSEPGDWWIVVYDRSLDGGELEYDLLTGTGMH